MIERLERYVNAIQDRYVSVYCLENTETIEVLISQEPTATATPDGIDTSAGQRPADRTVEMTIGVESAQQPTKERTPMPSLHVPSKVLHPSNNSHILVFSDDVILNSEGRPQTQGEHMC